jgi:hypothetical protein
MRRRHSPTPWLARGSGRAGYTHGRSQRTRPSTTGEDRPPALWEPSGLNRVGVARASADTHDDAVARTWPTLTQTRLLARSQHTLQTLLVHKAALLSRLQQPHEGGWLPLERHSHSTFLRACSPHAPPPPL